jgi:alkanesulfonate monooxygenase SsuD/methylene tetrahydromethanopterin reductase-like flavin-dependent oxidoreductase (luciferase family)
MHFAVGLPNVREYADPNLLVELALAAESAGWDGVFVWDHLLYREGAAAVNPWITTAAIAQATARIRIGVMVTALARRRPWNVAREAAALDILSNGRLMFGAGLGSLDDEFSLFGEDSDPRVRADKLDEALEIVTGLWTGEAFSYNGERFQIEEVRFLPAPIQSPRIPVLVAGRWPNRRPFRRAARWDGIFATHESVGHNETMTVEQTTEIVEYIHAHRAGDNRPLEVVIEGQTSGMDRDRDSETVAAYGRAGLTWWVEKLGWFRGTLNEMRGRIESGPPCTSFRSL